MRGGNQRLLVPIPLLELTREQQWQQPRSEMISLPWGSDSSLVFLFGASLLAQV
jgi:hypothetical protein